MFSLPGVAGWDVRKTKIHLKPWGAHQTNCNSRAVRSQRIVRIHRDVWQPIGKFRTERLHIPQFAVPT